MPQRLLTLSLVALAAALGTRGASALGFGPVRAFAVMGEPLDANVVLLADAAESGADLCVKAAVKSGDKPVADDAVTTSVLTARTGESRVRVRTATPIDEPFVMLTVSVGCDIRFSRQFTVFADPPATPVVLADGRAQALPSARQAAAERAPPARPAAPQPAAPRAVAGGAAPVTELPSRRSHGEVASAPAAPPPPRRESGSDRASAIVALNRSRAAAVSAPREVPAAEPPAAEKTAREQRVSTGVVARGESVARLRLDAPVVTLAPEVSPLVRATVQREEALATARIAVDVAQAANTSATQKVADLEAQLKAAQQQANEARSALARLQAEQERGWMGLGPHAVWLAAACGVLLLACGALFWRLRRADAERLQGWLKEPTRLSRYSEFDTVSPGLTQFSELPRSAPMPLPGSSMMPLPAQAAAAQPAFVPTTSMASPWTRQAAEPAQPASPRGQQAAPQPKPVPPAPKPLAPVVQAAAVPAEPQAGARTVHLDDDAAGQDYSIEELLDVEQQAEFFVVLGQDDAAVDLLTSHVMASGGASPLPYLKLLEILRRMGDQAAYERTRKRFNARFNGMAPEWGVDPDVGRSLEDYPAVVRRLQQLWSNPVDAMAELQTLMFRNDSNLIFDLPAYGDIMTLFTLARDLHEHGAGAQAVTSVDVLLPLDLPPVPAAAPAQPAANGPSRSASETTSRDEGELRLFLDAEPNQEPLARGSIVR
jgi:hypothetical protein